MSKISDEAEKMLDKQDEIFLQNSTGELNAKEACLKIKDTLKSFLDNTESK